MKSSIYKTVILEMTLIMPILTNTLVNKTTLDNTTYEALVKEKGELYKKINLAIEDSIRTLTNSSGEEAEKGLQYMKQLKEQLKEVNGTELSAIPDSNIRRRNKVKLSLDEIREYLDNRGFNQHLQTKQGEEKLHNKFRIQKELDLWMAENAEEAAAKNRPKLRNIKFENCPRWGYGRGKRKSGVAGRRQAGRPGAGGQAGEPGGPTADRTYKSWELSSDEGSTKSTTIVKNRYPCCRKCCKSSYMGCL